MQGFWRLFGKGRMFGRPFFKTNPEELSTLCIYPKQLLNNTKNVLIKKNAVYHKSCPIFLSCNLGGTSHEQWWPRSCSVLEDMQWTCGYANRYSSFRTLVSHGFILRRGLCHWNQPSWMVTGTHTAWPAQSLCNCLTHTGLIWVSVAPCRAQG